MMQSEAFESEPNWLVPGGDAAKDLPDSILTRFLAVVPRCC
jgi:hypothetical protein